MSEYKTVREGDKLTRTWTSYAGTVYVDEFQIVEEGADYWLITTSGETYRLRALSQRTCMAAAELVVESLGERVAYCTFPGAQVWEVWEKRWKKKVASGRRF